MCDAGVLWLQLTGGEPLIDKFFPQVYELAYELGMMISISSNGGHVCRAGRYLSFSPHAGRIALLSACTVRPLKVTTVSPGDADRSRRSPVATPVIRSFMWTRTVWPACARGVGIPRSR